MDSTSRTFQVRNVAYWNLSSSAKVLLVKGFVSDKNSCDMHSSVKFRALRVHARFRNFHDCRCIPRSSSLTLQWRRRRPCFLRRCSESEENRDSLLFLDKKNGNPLQEGKDQTRNEECDDSIESSGAEMSSCTVVEEGGGSGDGAKSNSESASEGLGTASAENSGGGEFSGDGPPLETMKDLLEKAMLDLSSARENSAMFEEKAQKISETAISLRDKASEARKEADETSATIQDLISEELEAKNAVEKAKSAVLSAEAKTKLAVEALNMAKESLKEQPILRFKEGEIGVKRDDMVAGKVLDASSEDGVDNTAEKQQDSEQLEAPTLKEETALLMAQNELEKCEATLAWCEAELLRIQKSRLERQERADHLDENARAAEMMAAKADEDVAAVMALAEQAVALEVEAAQRVSDAEIALQRAEKYLADTNKKTSPAVPETTDRVITQISSESIKSSINSTPHEKEGISDIALEGKEDVNSIVINEDGRSNVPSVTFKEDLMSRQEISLAGTVQIGNINVDIDNTIRSHDFGTQNVEGELNDSESEKPKTSTKDGEHDKSKGMFQLKKSDTDKDSHGSNVPKPSTNKSSRFFSASFFSLEDDGEEFTPAALFSGFVSFLKTQMPKLIVGALLMGAGLVYLNNRLERSSVTLEPAGVMNTIGEVKISTKPLTRELRKIPSRIKFLIEKLPHQEVNEEETSLFDVLWLLLASVIFVPLFQKIPGGSPVLGYLAAGILIGPYGLSIIQNVHGTKAIAEFGVVFLLFNIGLELSVERLSSMKKYVFGLGSAQVLATAIVVGLVAHFFCGQSGPAAIVIGNGLALSSTAVVLQVLHERGEMTSRHGRATFSVLLFQDLAVVVLLILIPLISPNSSKGGVGFQAIAEALGLAAIKAMIAISAIIAGGRLLLRPIYRQIAENQNAEIFSANTLLVVLGTAVLTARAGLSMALGAFLAGLLLAETEFSLQVESDIAPYRGLLLGLFFMTVGMSIDPKLLIARFPVIIGALSLLIGGKTLLVSMLGRVFGISSVAALRVGLMLGPGGEFAFVAFGEAVNQGIMNPQVSSLLFLVVGLSMAITPWLAAGGQLIASRFEQHDVRSLLPVESETDDLQDHIIICGFGRVGQIIAQLLSERLIPFVALDVRSERVAAGRALDLPVYFGDAGNKEVLHKVGAERATAAAVTLDTPGANYRTVWALNKYFPNVKTFVRAHDVDHGINLEKAGATAVVPETLEPSLQLAAALLAEIKLPTSQIAETINEFRSRHLSELTELCELSGSSPGYGYLRAIKKHRQKTSDSEDLKQEGMLAVN
eukprot:TRINITY_DN10645_c0_g1_i1.p1 TRINITY_DN10645_c0_g1~~TRINITY_DN10645_c0_g1_i1.p1  ORF type:complete len:1299 (-),score=306.34 TRINITY_DN10645_c0_g1_i1:215-4111(-)